MGAILQQHVQETYGLETAVPPRRHIPHGSSVTAWSSDSRRTPRDRRCSCCPSGPAARASTCTRANHVIHYDRWWNPAVENQATDRAFRIGQTRDVHVHKLICAGTLEDRIDLMIEAKRETAEQVVGTTSERWLTELSNTELREVLALSASPRAS